MPVSRNVTASLGKILLESIEDEPAVSIASIRTLTNGPGLGVGTEAPPPPQAVIMSRMVTAAIQRNSCFFII
jgi:hypothetical protein